MRYGLALGHLVVTSALASASVPQTLGRTHFTWWVTDEIYLTQSSKGTNCDCPRHCRARDLSPRRQASADSYRQCSIESVLSSSAAAAAATVAANTMAGGHRYAMMSLVRWAKRLLLGCVICLLV